MSQRRCPDIRLIDTEAASVLGHELSCLTALADSIQWPDLSSGKKPWDAISISGLKDVQRGSEVWEAGRQGVKAGLESVSRDAYDHQPS